jgi:uncharacterized membrane protein YkvA (DUF1232 family)
MKARFRDRVLRLKVLLLALWKLQRHPDTPRAVHRPSLALSPIDLIPDFIPVLGLLDDLVLIPLGLALIVKLTPPALWQARLREAEADSRRLPRLWWGALLVAAVWVAALLLLAWWMMGR